MCAHANTTVRMFGCLHTYRKDHGLEPTVTVTIEPSGCTALELANKLELPLDKVEAVFVNHLVYSLDHRIQPGDRVAFIPTGVPGPYRLLIGIASGKSGKTPSN
ncbi:MAG: MoaD/ThiS family protein [Desulfuromonadales bacterium]|nr:MoaD/ThiS family protein [Desulfuromonadales bacterium]